MTKRTPKPVNDGFWPKLGMGFGGILAQSPAVATAFGADRGFKLIVITIVAKMLVSGLALFFVSRAVHLFFG
jgi:hypothetical protein